MRILAGRVYRSGTRWCVWRWTDVDPDGRGEVYLTRLHLFQTPWCSCMLHRIRRADPQPDLHDHPNCFLSIVLRGWYDEESQDSRTGSPPAFRRVRWWVAKRTTERHRIVALAPTTLTLVFAGPVVRGWGFHTTDGWMPWREYVARYRSSQ
jgi:hypothetical protein